MKFEFTESARKQAFRLYQQHKDMKKVAEIMTPPFCVVDKDTVRQIGKLVRQELHVRMPWLSK